MSSSRIGNSVLAIERIDPKYYRFALARCNSGDEFDIAAGRKLATERLNLWSGHKIVSYADKKQEGNNQRALKALLSGTSVEVHIQHIYSFKTALGVLIDDKKARLNLLEARTEPIKCMTIYNDFAKPVGVLATQHTGRKDNMTGLHQLYRYALSRCNTNVDKFDWEVGCEIAKNRLNNDNETLGIADLVNGKCSVWIKDHAAVLRLVEEELSIRAEIARKKAEDRVNEVQRKHLEKEARKNLHIKEGTSVRSKRYMPNVELSFKGGEGFEETLKSIYFGKETTFGEEPSKEIRFDFAYNTNSQTSDDEEVKIEATGRRHLSPKQRRKIVKYFEGSSKGDLDAINELLDSRRNGDEEDWENISKSFVGELIFGISNGTFFWYNGYRYVKMLEENEALDLTEGLAVYFDKDDRGVAE